MFRQNQSPVVCDQAGNRPCLVSIMPISTNATANCGARTVCDTRELEACVLHFRLLSCKLSGTRWRSWLRHCATSRKVAGSISDILIGIFL